MSIMRCDGCGRPMDTDLEIPEERQLATGQEDWVVLCESCAERADLGWPLEMLRERA